MMTVLTPAQTPALTGANLLLTNARIVTADAVFSGTVEVRDGQISAIDAGGTALPSAQDLDGDYLLPGLIEMHTDNMEKHFEPRPGVVWPNALSAVVAHDLQIAGAGITTVFDAISIGEYKTKGIRREILAQSIGAVQHAQAADLLRAEHLIHLRCEVSESCVVEMMAPHLENPLVRLVSVMDHTPGQRQWSDISKFVQYHKGEHWTPAELDAILGERLDNQARYARAHRAQIVALSQEHGLRLASHDDACEAHILESVADGCAIAEFPITREAAHAARAHGLATIMGGPNVVRGGSHSGNIAALDLAAEGLLSGLSSDYVPSSLIQAVFIMAEKGIMPLPQAVACVSANIADMVGLTDRGRIAPGLRADLARVRHTDHAPVVRDVWRQGRRVA
jgi:alpha-D-ribose 1-methylphosphonate 5-triphosphate diphosphatase